MIEFVFGREPSSKTEYVIEKMKSALAVGKRCVLIIPEQQALFWDTAVAERFDPTDSFSIEVVSFKRLANSVFRTFGGCAKTYISDAERSLFMWNAIVSVSDKLKAFKSTDREDRYVPLMCRAVSETKLYGIGPRELMEASEKAKSPSLCARLHDLSLISAAYDTLLHSGKEDPEDIPDALCKALENNDYFSGSCVFIDSFLTLTPKEIKVVRHIFSQADDTLITFATALSDTKKLHTEYVSSYVKEMERSAARLGFTTKKTSCDDTRCNTFAYLSECLWDYGADPLSEGGECVSFIKCSDRYDEAALCAAKIRSLAADGASFGDIACVCADFESLRGITDIELERQGIPVYVAGKTPVTSQPALRLLLFATAVCAGGWKRDDIISCARTGLCSLSPDEADALEAYTEKWRIRGKKKFCADSWDMNADGYFTTESTWAKRMLSLANFAKDKLIPPIEAFSEAFPGTVLDICTAAYKLLCDFSVYEHLKAEVALLEKAGKRAEAQKKSQVWEAICRVLDTLAESVPDATLDARRFAALLKRTADTCHIGSIPDGLDRVVLGSVGNVRLDSVKHLIVLGAKSGEFPAVPKDGGFFSDADRKELLSLGIELSPDTIKKQREEMFRFAKAVSSPSESLTLIIPSEPSGNHPSLGALRLMNLLPNAKILDFTSPDAESIVRTGGKRDSETIGGDLSADRDRTTGAALTRLFDRDITLTQTRIECFNACAFKYYCQHVLRLDEGGLAELKPSDVGTFVHSVLENFVKEAAEEGFPLSDKALFEKTERLIEDYRASVLPEGEAGYVSYLFHRIAKSINLFARALNEEFSQSRFVPHSFELPVGFSADLPAIPIRLDNGHDLTVRGIVDRMDIMREGDSVFVRVVDYKTGSKTFSLKKVMKGENIQLLLYLFALCNMPRDCSFAKKLLPNGERLVPAGAVYFSAKPGDIQSSALLSADSADSFALDAISRTGIVLGDQSIMEAMDSTLSGKYCPAYIDKKGNVKGSFVETENDFNDIKNALDNILRDVGNRMISGEAGSCPSGHKDSSACKYCKMKPLCRHSEANKNNMGGEDDE